MKSLNVSVLLLVHCLNYAVGFAQIPKPDDAPQPLSPGESKKLFQLPEGFRIDLVASEPLISDPSCVSWDEKGRLFVTEIHGYNLEGHLDVTELNKLGKLDMSIRRVRVDEKVKAKAREGQNGSLKLLRDHDGDGRMDEAIVWADDIPAAYGIVPARGGVIVAAEPHIYFFADRDGDDRPDERKILFSGFGRGEMERAINNPVWGPDNWIYAGQGWGGGTITGPNLKQPVKLGRTDFRFKPDGSAIEPVSGSNHTFGLSFDDLGNRWLITTGQPARYAAPLPHRYLIRNPHVASPATTIGASPYGNCFPISQPHPWRRKRGADPRWVKFYGAGEAKPNGNFTSACGQEVYRASLFPEEFYGNHFCCDPQQNLVHRSLIARDGAGMSARRADEDSEFLASSDGWFRPNNLRVGPDGALYIVDMYREIIEDYSAIPRYLQQQYGLLSGDDRGRIWRLAPADSEPSGLAVGEVGTVGNLRKRDAWWRETAQRILAEEKLSTDSLNQLAADQSAPFQARISALQALDGQGRVPETSGLGDSHPAVRVQALRIGEGRIALDNVMALLGGEEDPSVLLQIALSLGEYDDPRVAIGLAKLAGEHLGVRWMDSAISSSFVRQPGAFLNALKELQTVPDSRLIEMAVATAVAVRDESAEGAVLKLIVEHPESALRLRLLELVNSGGFGDRVELGKIVAKSLAAAASDEERLAAYRLIGFAESGTIDAALADVFGFQRPPEYREKAVAAMLSTQDQRVGERFIDSWTEATPRTSAAILRGMLSSDDLTKLYLSSSIASASALSGIQRYRVLNHTDESVRALAEKLIARSSESVPVAEAAAFVKALKQEPDLAGGKKLFETHCAICHEFGGAGTAVGPSLDGEGGRPAESLLVDILRPATEITAGYETYLAKTKRGTSVAGVLASESATSITIAQASGASEILLRKNIESLERLDFSLMPLTFGQTLAPDEIAGIIGFLKNRPAAPGLVLFEDDPGFAAVLSDGKGTAKIDFEDVESGRACLTIEGFQRYSRQLPGWSFPIRESPADGEFRFINIAMKSHSTEGVMVEFAADRSFPPEDKPIRTYYAGKNSTGWNSNQLAKDAPKEWRSFTIDLWEGNGDFTMTGMAFTVMGGKASFDRIELLKIVE